MKILCVLNPRSGGGLALQRWPQVLDLLRSFGADHELLRVGDAPIESLVARRLEQGGHAAFDAIAGVGGDGTQSAILNGLMAFQNAHPGVRVPPYGLVPMGVGNDIAKSIGLTSRVDFFVDDLRRAVAALIHGADFRLDLGLVAGRHFADALTVGVDSEILRERNRRKRRLERRHLRLARWVAGGPMLYTWVVGPRLWRHRPVRAEVTVDGHPWYSGPIFNLVINNTRIYAGEFDFCPDSYGNDGRLDVVVFSGPRDYLSRYLLSLRRHPRQIRAMADRLARVSSRCQGRDIEIRLAEPQASQMDGEELPAGDRFRVTVVPAAVHLKVPVGP